MIICSKMAEVITRMALGKDKISVADLNSIQEQLLVDMSLTHPKKEAFVISENDIQKPKVRQQFLAAVAKKHPTVRVVVLAKAKTTLTAGSGIDKVLVAPKAPQVAEALNELLESIADKVPVIGSDEVVKPVPKFVPDELMESLQQSVEEVISEQEQEAQELPIHKEADVEPIPQYTEKQVEDSLMERIRNCQTVADINILAKEASATRIVKKLLEENNEYTAIEEKLKAYQQRIQAIMLDGSIPSLTEKLEKVRAISYDQAYYAAKGTTILEQRVEMIVNAITEKVREFVEEKNRSLDRIILEYSTSNTAPVIDFPMLSGLLDKRANIILDLALLNKEVKDVFIKMDKLTADVTSEVIKANTSATGVPALDNVIELRGAHVTLGEGVEVINRVLSLAVQTAEQFEGYDNTVRVMNDKIVALLKTDDAIIEQQSQIIKYLSSRDVEDAVVANTFIKKALRIFVGDAGVGRTFLPYAISKLRAKTSANVLYMDLTGEDKLEDYGIHGMELIDWMNMIKEEQFCVVRNRTLDMDEESMVQRLSNLLVKAADYYRVINVVVRPNQQLLIETLMQDAISINYITDMSSVNLTKTKKYIQETTTENIAQKVYLNKCSGCTENVVRKLGLEERLNVACVRFPYVPQIVDCALNGVDPVGVDCVEECLREVMKLA